MHEHHRVFGHVERAGFVSVEEGIVDEQSPAGRQGFERSGQELSNDGNVPVVQHIGVEVQVVPAGQGLREHVTRHHLDPVAESAGHDGLGANFVHRRFLEHGSLQFREMGAQRAGVNARSTGDVQQGAGLMDGQVFSKGARQKNSPAIHGLGELLREVGLLHGLVPVGL